ncbi:hypothetical protein E2C01_007251 [Portunus trituberculatus]|uniref:Uncharacterized protein n=1 Tax=Portunus trituberculatus TaxID=210409 RepID=A0A5B7D0F5_PORTR|nr:hypothetical protein [Portunus trituberculatus]
MHGATLNTARVSGHAQGDKPIADSPPPTHAPLSPLKIPQAVSLPKAPAGDTKFVGGWEQLPQRATLPMKGAVATARYKQAGRLASATSHQPGHIPSCRRDYRHPLPLYSTLCHKNRGRKSDPNITGRLLKWSLTLVLTYVEANAGASCS